MNIKRLNLDNWMLCEYMLQECIEDSDSHEPVIPLGYSGKFLFGERCWFELSDGRAYTYEKDMFKYEMELENVKDLNQRQVNALRGIVKQKIATKEQRRMAFMYDCMEDVRNIYRSALLYRKRITEKS